MVSLFSMWLVLPSTFKECRTTLKPKTLSRVEADRKMADFAKAFDYVSHEHLQRVLKQRDLDQHIMALIGSTYEKSTTRIIIDRMKSSMIDMSVGVKQGDPMSPLLFNLALEPLIQDNSLYS